MASFADRINARVATSIVGTHFRLEGCGHPKQRIGSRFLTELRAGVTTWAAMAYIISVNASILSTTGGPCVCTDTADPTCASDSDYQSCVTDVNRDLITATAASAAMASFLMGLFANLPVGLAPGLGLNAYFAYSIVGTNGTGSTTYGEALAAVFLEGWIFFALSLLGLRQWLARAMPHSLVMAVGAGIGFFIAFIGLSSSGLFIVGGDTSDLVGLGGCTTQYALTVGDTTLSAFCASHVLQSPTTWLGVFLGGFLTVFLMLYRIRGSLLIGIAVVSIVSWPRGTAVTAFPDTAAGDEAFAFFKQVASFQPLGRVGNAIDWGAFRTGRVWYALVTLLYVDILDTTGTLYSMAKFAGLRDPITLDFENSTWAYCVDAFSISMGALMGTSPVTAFVESATGVAEGGRTGLTAIVVGLCFFLSVFFAPIFASIPDWATGAALVIVGSLMIRNVREINWDYPGDAIPSFLTLIMIPLTYNIAYGVIAGLGSYVILNGGTGLIRVLTKGRVSPVLYELGERWRVPPGGLVPAWIRHLVSGLRSGRGGWWRVWEGAGEDEHVMRGVGVGVGSGMQGMQGLQSTTSTVAGRNGSLEYPGPGYANSQYGGRYGAGETLYGPQGGGGGSGGVEVMVQNQSQSQGGMGMGAGLMHGGGGVAGMQGVVLGNSPSYGGKITTVVADDDSGSEKDPSVVGVGYPPRKFA